MSHPRKPASFAAMLSAMVAAAALLAAPAPVRAARPLLDQPQWDRYFALSAPNAEVPWKPASVRLATYSGAPVDFAVYNIDPAEVIVAGRNRAARPIDTSRRTPLARWRFAPPRGYRFEVSEVTVPIGEQEGFYVIEARRGSAAQQVWLNRTHIGLVTKESPDGLLLWAADLRDGAVLRDMHVAFLVGQELVDRQTDSHGMILWRTRPRPVFALADRGAARAFLSLLPQAPLPSTIVGLRLERSSARAGQSVGFTGFVRHRATNVYRRATGDVRVTLLGQGRTLETTTAHLDAAGAFVGRLTVPASSAAGDYAVLASVSGGVAGTALHVDSAAEVALTLGSNCPCAAESDVVLKLTARDAHGPVVDYPVSIRVIRSPHIIPPGENEDRPRWGTTLVADERARTDAYGVARVDLPPPSDGLASTYGVRAGADGATATTSIAVPTSSIGVAIEPDVTQAAVGEPVGFTVRGFDAADGTPKAGLPVRVRLVHGPVAWSQEARLDADGRAHLSFTTPSLGSNLAFVEAADAVRRRALDVAAVTVDPSNRHASDTNEERLTVTLDRARYQTGDQVHVHALTPGAKGAALVTLEGAQTYETRIAEIADGHVEATLSLPPMLGQARVGVAAVHDGAVELGSAPLAIEAPGRVRALTLSLGGTSFAPGAHVRGVLNGGRFAGGATITARLTEGRESDSASLDDASEVLSIGGTTTQNPASVDPAWHTFVESTHSNAADVYAAERPRTQSAQTLSLGAAVPNSLFWRTARTTDGSFPVDMPTTPGTYVLSVLAVGDDGGVGAASATVSVR